MRFLKFLLAGGLAAVMNFASRFLFSIWLPYTAAIICAYLVGMTTAFILMRRFVFDVKDKPWQPQVVKFGLVNILALTQTLVISLLLARWVLPRLGLVDGVEAIAHAIGVAVPVVTSYIGHRFSTFK